MTVSGCGLTCILRPNLDSWRRRRPQGMASLNMNTASAKVFPTSSGLQDVLFLVTGGGQNRPSGEEEQPKHLFEVVFTFA